MICIENLVCEGGGVKALAFIGAVKRLEEANLLQQVNHFAGSSAGAITATLLACGYTSSELESILTDTDFQDKIDGNLVDNVWTAGLYRLWKSYGLFPTNGLTAWIETLVAKKIGKSNATLKDLFNFNGNTLVITTTSVKKAKTIYYSHAFHPDLLISEAVKRSMSIPLFFEANFVDEDVLVDGGMLSNYPIWIFDERDDTTGKLIPNPNTLGLKLMEITEQPDSQLFHGTLDVNNLTNYMVSLLECLLVQIERLHIRSEYWERTIPITIGDVKSTDFALSDAQKQNLVKQGYDCTDKWLKEKTHLFKVV